MSRVVGTVNVSQSYEVTTKKPLDARMLVPTYADLTVEANWVNGTDSIAYNGMIVAVAKNTDDLTKNGIYYLFDSVNTGSLKKPVVTDENNWHKLCDLNELSLLSERVSELEQGLNVSGITKEELDASIDSLRGEIESAGYLTEDKLFDYGFITQNDFSTYATQEDVDSLTQEIDSKLDTELYETEKATFALKLDIPTNYATQNDINQLNDKVNSKADASHQHTITEIEGYDPSTLDSKLEISTYEADKATFATNTELESKADKSTLLSGYGIIDAYTKTEVDAKLTELSTGGSINLDGYVSEDEWNERVTTFATKEELTAAVADASITYGTF